MATFRAASATLIAAPSAGSTRPTPATASVAATSAFVVPLIRRTAAPRPGPATVLAWTWLSYCSKTQARDARFGEPIRASRTAPGSMPRSGSRSIGSSGAPGAGARRRRTGGLARRSWMIASDVSAAAGIRASTRPPSRTTMSRSPVTRPITATGRPQRVQTSRTAASCSGATIATIRSCDSEIITSNGAIPASRSGIDQRSMSIPVPARSAVSEVPQVMPPAPRSWRPSTSPRSISSSEASMRSFSANGSPTWTLGRLDGSSSVNVALARTEAPPIPSRPVVEPNRTTRFPTPGARASVSSRSSSSPMAMTLTSGLPW